MNKKIRCANPACRCHFIPNPRIKNQQYCNRKDCQRVRKRLWQRRKMKSDPDYVKTNLRLQKVRDDRRRDEHLAKMDALNNESAVKAGCYYIFSGEEMGLAKMDAIDFSLLPHYLDTQRRKTMAKTTHYHTSRTQLAQPLEISKRGISGSCIHSLYTLSSIGLDLSIMPSSSSSRACLIDLLMISCT